ncbi:hypothetical protein OAD37_03555 [Gammaproteobacteria bacterium]|nr:hypothetical protein [Gammaproteobacteria bacterium]
MRVLTIFIDMIRANRLSTFNSNIKKDTPLDIAFKEMGGTTYTNCFIPGPDTPRGMSTFYTGVNPYQNGCNTRLKWPQYFLDKDLNTIFDLFIDKGFKIDCYASPKERDTGLYPSHINDMNVHNKDYDLNKYLSELKLQNDHFLFVSIPDYHWAFDDFGYSVSGEKKAYKVTKSVFDIVFKNLNKDDFDHIFIFSDHGFKFTVEQKREPKSFMLNEDRTNSIMLHRTKGQESLVKNDKLCSIADLYPTYEAILYSHQTKNFSLLSDNEHKFIVLEDHINFAPSINQNIELWALVNKDIIYIRELDKVSLINRATREVTNEIIAEYDDILKNNSSFGAYVDEYEKIFRYRKNILSIDSYMNCNARKKSGKLKKYLNQLVDFLSYRD